MAVNKNRKKREVQFELTDDDYKAFGRYRILYTDQGHKMVRRQKATLVVIGLGVAALFTLFKVDRNFTILMYVLSAACVVAGLVFGERMVLRQQDKSIDKSASDIERVRPQKNIIEFGDDGFTTYAGSDVQNFSYADVQKVDLTEAAVYVWMSDTMIMPVPLHAFRDMQEMKEFCKWFRKRVDEQKGTASEEA